MTGRGRGRGRGGRGGGGGGVRGGGGAGSAPAVQRKLLVRFFHDAIDLITNATLI